MMEAVRTTETSVNSHQSTRRYKPEDGHLHAHRRENFKSYWLNGVDLPVLYMKTTEFYGLLLNLII
jgi:hypothetical protein